MKVKLRVLLTIICISMLFMGCEKEKIKGCKTSFAINYNSKAQDDDGSCMYSSKVIFWQNSSNAAILSSSGVSALYFYVNGGFIGSCGSSAYLSSSPGCSSGGLVEILRENIPKGNS